VTAHEEPEQGTVVRLPVGRSWSQPLAIAAVAMLVIGVGLATIGIRSRPEEGAVAEVEPPAPANVADEVALPPPDEAIAPEEPTKTEPEPAERLAAAPAQPEDTRPARKAAASKEKRKKSKPRPKPEEPVRVAQETSAQKTPAKESTATSVEAARVAEAETAEPSEPLPSLQTKGGKTTPALAEGNAVGAGSACQKRVALFEKLMATGRYKPSAQEQLDVGLCYKKLGKPNEARRWLEGASEDPATRDRALEALQSMQ
jgi:hypothetical protein